MINSFRNYSLLLVVFIHAHIYLLSYANSEVPDYLEYIYYNFLGFFHPASILAAISGYLFYKDYEADSARRGGFNRDKYAKRIKSLAKTYFFWVLLFFVINNLLIYLMRQNTNKVFINNYHEVSVLNYIKALFYPDIAVAGHLWYLNNLLFVFILAPLIPILNRWKFVFLGLMVLISVAYWYIFTINPTKVNLVIKFRFIVFYLGGAFLGLNRSYLNYFLEKQRLLLVSCAVILCVMIYVNFCIQDLVLHFIVGSLIIPVVVFGIAYTLFKKLTTSKETIYNRSKHFLLYIIHPMVLSIICKLVFFTIKPTFNNYYLLFVAILVASWITVKINDLVYYLLNRYFKKFVLNFL